MDIKVQISVFRGPMISQSAEYSLRAVVCLASRPGSALTTRQIAHAAHIPPGYLAKIMQALTRAGTVASHRGVNGGFVLAKDPEHLTLLDVVQVVDPSRRIRSCPLKLPSHGTNLCALHRRIDQAAAAVEQTLGDSTVAQMLGCGCAPTLPASPCASAMRNHPSPKAGNHDPNEL